MTSTHTNSSSVHSAPSSPATTMTSTHTDAGQPPVDNSLDDIFGSSPPQEPRHDPQPRVQAPTAPEPSDLPSLRRQHITAGYRDGVAMSKGEHVQDGFDGGYPVGARLGMRAGTVLGILEGITRGLEERGASGVVKKPATARGTAGTSSGREDETGNADARRRTRDLVLRVYQDAMKSLDVQSVFAGLDAGAAPRQVDMASGPDENAPEPKGERAETKLGMKGDAAVSRWEERVAVPRWEENMETLETSQSQGDKGAAGERS